MKKGVELSDNERKEREGKNCLPTGLADVEMIDKTRDRRINSQSTGRNIN